MNAIVVVDENWKIGRDGGLLVHLSGDLKYFKERTYGKTIVIGRKTLESFSRKKAASRKEKHCTYKAEGLQRGGLQHLPL